MAFHELPTSPDNPHDPSLVRSPWEDVEGGNSKSSDAGGNEAHNDEEGSSESARSDSCPKTDTTSVATDLLHATPVPNLPAVVNMPPTAPAVKQVSDRSLSTSSQFISLAALGLVICPLIFGLIGSLEGWHTEGIQQACASLQALRNGTDLEVGSRLTAGGRLNNIASVVEAQAEVLQAMVSIQQGTTSQNNSSPLLFVLSLPVLIGWCFCVDRFVRLSPPRKFASIVITGGVSTLVRFLYGLITWEGRMGSFLQATTLVGSLGLFFGYIIQDDPNMAE